MALSPASAGSGITPLEAAGAFGVGSITSLPAPSAESGSPLSGKVEAHGFSYAWDADGGMRITPSKDRPHIGLRDLAEGESSVRLRLRGMGYGNHPQEVEVPAAMRRTGTGFAADREGISETYTVSQPGLDHGFILNHRPGSDQPGESLTIAIGMETGLSLKMPDPDTVVFEDREGRGVWTYRHLFVHDAEMRGLPARMELEPAADGQEARVLLCINDAEARYPLTVDPTFASLEVSALPNPPSVINGQNSDFIYSATLGDYLFFVADDGAYGNELWRTHSATAETSLVKDIRSGSFSSRPSRLTAFNGFVYFLADDDNHALPQLWRSDGTPAGTSPFFDLEAAGLVFPESLTATDDFLWFIAYGRNSTVPQLWRTDGTKEGTKLMLSGAGQALPNLQEAVILGNLFVYSYSDQLHGTEVWRSDGTVTGTRILKDFVPGNSGSFPRSLIRAGDKVFFLARYSMSEPDAVWMTDGSEAGTVRVTEAGAEPAYPLTSLGSVIYYAVPGSPFTVPGSSDTLWKTDGTSAGTVAVRSFPSAFDAGIRILGTISDTLYFTHFQRTGVDLHRTDGTEAGTRLVSSVSRATGLTPLETVGGRLYFVLYRTDESGQSEGGSLWSTDGTETGTVQIADVRPGTELEEYRSLGQVDELYYFTADDGIHGREIWRTNGTAAGTWRVKDIVPNATAQRPTGMTILGNRVIFAAFDPVNGRELWASDGTAGGTALLRNLKAGPESGINSTDSHQFTVVGDLLYLIPHTGGFRSLWRTDGTSDGTFVVKTPITGPRPSPPGPSVISPFRDLLLIPEAEALWRSDGTLEGTQSLGLSGGESMTPMGQYCLFAHRNAQGAAEIWRTDGSNTPMAVVTEGAEFSLSGYLPMPVVNGQALLQAIDPAHGLELWKTDGTKEGTQLVRDITPGVNWSDIAFLPYNGTGRFYFTRKVSSTRLEFWSSDGTTGGTVKFAEVNPGTYGIGSAFRNGNSLFFVLSDTTAGYELWHADGTSAGTKRLKDINPGNADSMPDHFTALGSKTIFLAETASAGREPWVSDGTTAGTRLLADILPGAPGSNPVIIGSDGRFIYLAATDAGHGRELWVTDGTPEGTRLAEDLNPGSASSFPFWLGKVGARIVTMYDNDPTAGGLGIRQLVITPVPHVQTGAALNIQIRSATFTGQVDTDGGAGAVHFEYGPTAEYGFTTPPQDLTSTGELQATATNLPAASAVHYRLVYETAGQTVVGDDKTILTGTLRMFAGTDTGAPEVFSDQTAAALSAQVPEGSSVTRSFTILNSGSAPVQVERISLPDTFAIGEDVFPATIGAGESLTFEISQFSAKFGVFSGNLVLSAGGGYPTFLLPLQVQDLFVNDPPVMNSVPLLRTPEDNAVTGILTATDPDEQPLTFVPAGTAVNGMVTIQANGQFTFVPARDFSGSASFSAKATDGSLNSNVVTVAIEVLPVADPPVLDTVPLLFTAEDQLITGSVKGSSVEGRSLTYALTSQPDAASGTLTFLPDGTFRFQPAKDFTGAASFIVRASDGLLDSNAVLVVILITPVNDPPLLTLPTTLSIVAGIPYAGIQATATDPDNAAGSLQWTTSSSNPALLPAADILLSGEGGERSLDFVTVAGSPGGLCNVTVTVSDGISSTSRQVAVTVIPNRTEITRQPNGTVQLRFTGVPGRPYAIQRSSDISNWTPVQSVTATATGEILWTDPAAPAARAFYRLTTP